MSDEFLEDEILAIDIAKAEEYLDEKTKSQNYELKNITREKLIEFIIDKFAKLFNSSNIEKTAKRYEKAGHTQNIKELQKRIEELQKRAEIAFHIIYSSIYYYQYYMENKDDKVKKKFSAEEQKIKKKVKEFIEILEPNNQENTEQNKLLSLLEDMQKNPYKYAKVPKVIPTAKIDVRYVKDTIVQALSDRLICRVKDEEFNALPMKEKIKRSHKHGFNAVDEIFRELPF